MSQEFDAHVGVGAEFRIPMRGYELQVSGAQWVVETVPNPHEGL